MKQRLGYLDWIRGLAVALMIWTHVFNSWARPDQRNRDLYQLTQWIGGMPAAMFLFMVGVTLAFLLDKRECMGESPAARWRAGLGRARYLLAIALAFRLQLWIFGWGSSWTNLFKVDILNCMALAIAVLSALAIPETRRRAVLAAFTGAAIAGIAPLISAIDWSRVPFGIRDYIIPATRTFGFFPWASYAAFGLSWGSLLRTARPEQIVALMQWSALASFGLMFGGHYFASLPYSLYTSSNFWIDSPTLVAIKLGILLILVPFAYLWDGAARGWSWLRQIGTTSLLVYWVHVELVYGNEAILIKKRLTVEQCALGAVIMTGLMLALSIAKTRFIARYPLQVGQALRSVAARFQCD